MQRVAAAAGRENALKMGLCVSSKEAKSLVPLVCLCNLQVWGGRIRLVVFRSSPSLSLSYRSITTSSTLSLVSACLLLLRPDSIPCFGPSQMRPTSSPPSLSLGRPKLPGILTHTHSKSHLAARCVQCVPCMPSSSSSLLLLLQSIFTISNRQSQTC